MMRAFDMPVIQWTQSRVAKFKQAYQQAVTNQVETFLFEGNQFVTAYAKYLLEYLAISDPE